MDSAASALRYWERKQEVVANNLANATTDGFKAQRIFARLLDGMRPEAQTGTDMTVGGTHQTGNALDLAMDQNQFLVVSTTNGERFINGGSLRLDADSKLVDADGHPVLGIKGPIRLKNEGPIEISAAGDVKQGGQFIDRLRVETMAPGTELTREGGLLYVPPTARQVLPPADRTIKQGYIEDSNVNSIGSMVDMVAIQRAYASVQKAIVALDQVHETASTQLAKPV